MLSRCVETTWEHTTAQNHAKMMPYARQNPSKGSTTSGMVVVSDKKHGVRDCGWRDRLSLQTRPYRGKILVIISRANQHSAHARLILLPALMPWDPVLHPLPPPLEYSLRHGQMVGADAARYLSMCSAPINPAGLSSTTMKCFGTKSKIWCECRVFSPHHTRVALTNRHSTGRAP